MPKRHGNIRLRCMHLQIKGNELTDQLLVKLLVTDTEKLSA